ncbi:molybdenum ABC transporter ATP-binding protein [Parvularcula dongshanensis]|uniref:Molybdate transport system ATP-binding protein n=1 Tax=Parvularcula dongshanensis TaxID=1173995 RepID=A0A840I4K2_9PROT|nr:molybdate transport system ATP-binding protein [Parvularcula dongshanensis]
MRSDALEVEAVVRYRDFTLDVAQRFPPSGCTAVFGPSGSGKSTLLRAVAGFVRPQAGRIAFGEAVWFEAGAGRFVPPHRRPVGSVFQDGRLFPHLSVERNLAYAQKRGQRREQAFGLDEVVEAFALGDLLSRSPATLSGGEGRRVALARTLLCGPRLLLLDEPLAGLDGGRKAEILPYLEALIARFALPVLLVSHDAREAALLAERTAVMSGGRIAAFGPTAEVLSAEGIAGHAGSVLTGTVAGHDEEAWLTTIETGAGAVFVPLARERAVGAAVRLYVDPRNVALATAPPRGLSIRNVLSAQVASVQPEPGTAFAEIVLDAAGDPLRSQITKAAAAELALDEGQAVFALIKSASFDD